MDSAKNKEQKIKDNYQKNILLKSGIVLLSLIIIFISIPKFRDNALDSLSSIYASLLVELTNKNRVDRNISELKVNPLLESAAQMKADDMASKGYFAHNTPDGKTPWYWIEKAGYKYLYAGENLAVNFENSEDVENAWMNSEGHRLNILNPRYTEVGIATSTGTYKGRTATFVVQMFASPLK